MIDVSQLIPTNVRWYGRILLLGVLFKPGTLVAQSESGDPPNILVVYLDDFGWRDCGFMGSDFYETPNLDRLASEAMVFSDSYAGAANCAPSRACLMSGQYTPRHEIYNVGTKPRGQSKNRLCEHVPGVDVLRRDIVTWPKRLQEEGYRTATIGKWHLSDDPLPYGFDVNIGGTHSGSPPKGYYPPHPNAPGLEDAPEDEYLTDRLAEEAIQFIKRSSGQRWMLYLTHFAVHTPLTAKQPLVEKYEAKTPGELHDHVAMATMIQAVDEGIGRILGTLKELRLLDKTLIVFTSDNGGYGPATDMAPLKGYKGTYNEGGIRVPLFVWWPARIAPGKTPAPVAQVDLYPTICEIAGATMSDDQVADGISLLPLLTGQTDSLPERSLFWHFPAYLQAYRGVTDEQRDPLFRSRPVGVIRRGDWKLMEFFESGDLELYNLRDDIGETKNLAASLPDKTRELHEEMKAWRKETGAPVPKRRVAK